VPFLSVTEFLFCKVTVAPSIGVLLVFVTTPPIAVNGGAVGSSTHCINRIANSIVVIVNSFFKQSA
jgi:hypothetical protein